MYLPARAPARIPALCWHRIGRYILRRVNAPSSYYHDSGQYGLTVTTGGSVGSSETEDNGSVSSADVLSSGAKIMGQLSSSSDVDYYSIVASSAGTVTLDFDAPTNSSYTIISG